MAQIESTDIQRWLDSVSSASKNAKNKKFLDYLHALASKPKRQRVSVNLNKLDKIAKDGENIVVPGKVLGVGRMSKKINISAIRYSKDALAKLKDANCTVVKIDEMAKKTDVRIII